MDWRAALVNNTDTVLAALQSIQTGERQIAVVVDDQGLLQGVVTDGDIRAHILAGRDLNAPVTQVMNPSPLSATIDEDRRDLLATMRCRKIHQLPLLDTQRRVAGIVTIDELLQAEPHSNWVVLMAGGFGTRLRPLTDMVPKPMLKVGTRPVLETIIQQFMDYGFARFAISVHYKADVIKSYFGDGRAFGAEIIYIEEDRPLGTAGALTLLPFKPTQPFFVMNGDLLTKLNFTSLLQFHSDNGAPMTMCVREHALPVPYGVAEVEGNHLQQLVEKPIYRKLVNAGIYVCEPNVVASLPHDEPVTMVDLAHVFMERKQNPAVFPIHEYWIDIGQQSDLQRAEAEFAQIFG